MKDLQTAVDSATKAIKIDFSPDEKAKLVEETAAFLAWLEPLLKVDTGGSDPVLFSHESGNVFREDRPAAGDLEKLQSQSQGFEEGFYRVPSIID